MTDKAACKSDRMLRIYVQLSSGKRLNMEELARRFGVTYRSIQRDIESLRQFLAQWNPRQRIEYDRKAKAYCMKNDAGSSLTDGEIMVLCHVLLECRVLGQRELQSLLNKLIGLCGLEESKRTLIHLLSARRREYTAAHDTSMLETVWELGQAVEHHRVTELEYLEWDGKVCKYTIEPEKMIYSQNAFYLVGSPQDRGGKEGAAFGWYRVDRIAGCSMKNECFVPRSVLPEKPGEA